MQPSVSGHIRTVEDDVEITSTEEERQGTLLTGQDTGQDTITITSEIDDIELNSELESLVIEEGSSDEISCDEPDESIHIKQKDAKKAAKKVRMLQ